MKSPGKRPGTHAVRLTVTYTGVFRPTGTPDWIPVDGTADVTSPPATLRAIEARAVLVP